MRQSFLFYSAAVSVSGTAAISSNCSFFFSQHSTSTIDLYANMNDGTKNTTPNSATSALVIFLGSLFMIEAIAFANALESVMNEIPAAARRAIPIDPNTSAAVKKGLFFI